MIKISPAILEDTAVYLLKSINSDFRGSFKSYFSKNKDLFQIKDPSIVQGFIESLSIKTTSFKDNMLNLSKRFIKKMVVSEYIKKTNPPWAKRIKWGIKIEVYDYIKEKQGNLYSCLLDCGLLSDGQETITWWYKNISVSNNNKNELIGLQGEFLSYKYETEILRINKENVDHVSLKKSNVGYDILSVISNTSKALKPIEVKTSTRDNDPHIFLTRNEWEKASLKNYVFHVWILDSINKSADLYFIWPDEIKKNVPVDKGLGRWENTKIKIKNYCNKKVTTLNNVVYDF